MTVTLVSTTISIEQVLNDDDTLLISRDGAVSRSGGISSVSGSGGDLTVLVDGIAEAFLRAIDISATGLARVDVGEDGMVRGFQATGVTLTGDSLLTNRGLIWGGFYAIDLRPAKGEVAEVRNDGTLAGGNTGFYNNFTGDYGRIEIVNTGLIVGSLTSLDFTNAGTSVNVIRNTGEMLGDLQLGAGADVYDGRGGTLRGAVAAGAGNDRIVASLAAEVFDGGDGRDTLDFGPGGAVRVSLTGSFAGTGAAAGDTYTGFEVVAGSAAADRIEGGTARETLRGQGGADTISGAAGADRIEGGAGIDRLTGAGGNDVFIFSTLAHRGDLVTDFGSVAGNNDRFELSAAAFGGGLSAGSLAPGQFRIRADNLAQDANDRFIFRTTDRTLWFDANGNAAGGLTLVADLQAGASVTAGDILLV
jgi:Ca2+-binding RTX toxin-like protein